MVHGFDHRISSEFFVIGIVAALFAGFAYNIIRRLGPSEHPLVIVFYFPLVTMPITGTISIFDWVQPAGMEWILVLAIGICVQIAQYFMTMAYQSDDVSKIASMKYVSIIYALSFGWFFFDEHFTLFSYLGMGMVIVGVLLNVIYKAKVKVT